MTTHLDGEQLAEWALTRQRPDAGATEHLRLCPACRSTLDELRTLAGLTADLPRLERPADDVWQRITDELDLPRQPIATLSAASPVKSRARSVSRRALVLAASVAAVLGLGLGVLGTTLVGRETEPPAQAVVKLEPLQGKTGDGTADLVTASGGEQLRVSASGLSPGRGHYEVWLINEDGRRMVSLGVLDPARGGTFRIPTDATGQGYRIVDVSLEPDDGNPAHSLDSVIRGTLPA